MNMRTVQVPSKATLSYLEAFIAKEASTTLGPIDLLSGFPPRSLRSIAKSDAPISSYLRTNEMIIVASRNSSSSNKKNKKRNSHKASSAHKTHTNVMKSSSSSRRQKPRSTTTSTNTNDDGGVMLLRKLSQKRMESHLNTIRANKRLRAAFGNNWKFTENKDTRRADGQVSEIIVQFKSGQRKWESETVTKMNDEELRSVIRHVIRNLHKDAREQLRLQNLAQVSPRVFWNVCIWNQKNPMKSLSTPSSLESALRRLLPSEDWSFLDSRKRTLSAKAKENLVISEKDMHDAAKLIAEVAMSKTLAKEEDEKVVWNTEGIHIGRRVTKYFSSGPSYATVVMYVNTRRVKMVYLLSLSPFLSLSLSLCTTFKECISIFVRALFNILILKRNRRYAKPGKNIKEDPALWKIRYDNGDEEDLEEEELKLAIEESLKWKSKGHPYIGRRVLRAFDDDILIHGTVVRFYDADSTSDMLWHVVHDDGDEEDLSRKQVEDAIELLRQKDETSKSGIKNDITLVISEREIVDFLKDKIHVRTLEDLAKSNAFKLRQEIRQGLRIRVTEDGVQEYIDRAQILASNLIMLDLLDNSPLNIQSLRRVAGIRFPVHLSRCVPEELHRKLLNDGNAYNTSLDSVRRWIKDARRVIDTKSWLKTPPPAV